MKKINFLNIMCVIVLIAIIATLIYAFHKLYIYRTVDNSISTETVTETVTGTVTNWADEFEKNFRHSNAQYEEIAKDVNKNITTIEPVEHPDFN